MKISSKLVRNISVLNLFFSFNLYAQTKVNTNKSISNESQLTQQEDQETNSLSIELNVKSLDLVWDKRESEEEQNILIAWIQTEPVVPQNFDVAWRVARLVYFAGNFGLGEDLSRNVRVKMFSFGYKAAEIAKKLNPKKVEGHYWYAVDLGSYGLAKGVFSALGNAAEGRDALLEAAKIDPSYHWGGAYRTLGRYYQELPSVISFGDKKIARDYFNKALAIAPNFITNKLNLGILLSEEGDKVGAKKLFIEAQNMPVVDGKDEHRHYKEKLALELKKVED